MIEQRSVRIRLADTDEVSFHPTLHGIIHLLQVILSLNKAKLF